MKQLSKPIVFFGSGPVAAESLRLLLTGFKVEAVITKPTTEHEMKIVAGNLPVYTVSKKAELDALIESKVIKSELGILIDFGIIVSQKVIDYFPLGIINSHFSVLPQWRGADPINFAILSGQNLTGVSIMMLVEAMDEGPLLGYGEYELTGTENSTQLTAALIKLSHALLLNEIPRLVNGETKGGAPQSVTKRAVSYSRKLTKQDGILDFTKTAKELEAEVRAFIEWPKSRTEIAGKDVVITKAHATPSNGPSDSPGDIIIVPEAKMLGITTANGTLWIDKLKPAGKKEMPVSAFLAGYGNKL